jgi:hypothetical protein
LGVTERRIDPARAAGKFSRARNPTDLQEDRICTSHAFVESPSEEARRRTIEVPNEIAANADEVERLAGRVGRQLTSSVAGDAAAAEELARAASRDASPT